MPVFHVHEDYIPGFTKIRLDGSCFLIVYPRSRLEHVAGIRIAALGLYVYHSSPDWQVDTRPAQPVPPQYGTYTLQFMFVCLESADVASYVYGS